MATGDPLLAEKIASGAALTGVIADRTAKLTTARTISLTNDVSGSSTFDGSGDMSIAATLDTKITAGAYSGIENITVGADGRISAITTGT
jgi:hypothetical protein